MDAGDFFGLRGEQDSLKSAFAVEAMDRLGYDVVALGERELNFGQRFLLDSFKKTKIDLVSANLVDARTKKPFVKPYVVKKAGSVRIAFVGLIGSDVKIREFEGDRPLKILDPILIAKELVPRVRKKADVVVVLSHLGLTASQRLALEVSGVDVMIFGHLPGLYRSLVKTQNVITVRGGDRGQFIPSVHLVVEDRAIQAFDGEVVPLDEKIPADEETHRIVDAFSDDLNARFSRAQEADAARRAQETAAHVAGDRYLGEGICRRCHEAEYEMVSHQPHAHAFDTLVKSQRESTPECVACHVVGFGQAGGFISRASTPDLTHVQCESCHGMGTKHPQPGDIVEPGVCLRCHNSSQDPDFEYDLAVEKIVHW